MTSLTPSSLGRIARVNDVPPEWGPPLQTYERLLHCTDCVRRTMHDVLVWINWDPPWPSQRMVAVCRDEHHRTREHPTQTMTLLTDKISVVTHPVPVDDLGGHRCQWGPGLPLDRGGYRHRCMCVTHERGGHTAKLILRIAGEYADSLRWCSAHTYTTDGQVLAMNRHEFAKSTCL